MPDFRVFNSIGLNYIPWCRRLRCKSKVCDKRYSMDRLIGKCIEDMEAIASSGKYYLEAQVRAYDLLEQMMEIYGDASVPEDLKVIGTDFCAVYQANSSILDSAYDSEILSKELSELLAPLNDACNEARFQAAAAASLHEFAKEVFDIWQNSGVFARRRALRELRERAGFRLESHRIGNYVAKTFDLQNEAAARFARAQQAVYKADVRYKIKPGIYKAIALRLL